MKINSRGLGGWAGRGVPRRAFSLIEALVVVAILAVLAGILLPTLQQSRLQGRILRAHSDLRQIGVALEAYMMDYQDKVPPTRCGCSQDVQYQLPVELAARNYLQRAPGLIPQAAFPDVFNPANGYKYRAPGPIWLNGTYFDYPHNPSKPRGSIWVPDDFPSCMSREGRYYYNLQNEPRSPAVFAIWSVGPDPQSPKYPRSGSPEVVNESQLPLPAEYWYTRATGTGLITHFRGIKGQTCTSP